jgi:AraC-like DNA-binding protein
MKTIMAQVNETAQGDDLFAQQQIIEEALKRFTDFLNSRLDFFPVEIQEIFSCMHEHLFESSLTVEDVKMRCGLTNNNITTIFRQIVGVGMHEYIVNQRLKAAASVLRNNQVRIYLLAYAVGYSEETFSRLFKKTYGCPPLQYCRSAGERN